MGLSFHYKGRIAKSELLPHLIDEIQDIANAYKWEYNIYERCFPHDSFGKRTYNQEVYGICFTPPHCETIPICFLSNGKMSSDLHLQFFGKTETREEQDYLYMLSVKTQYAGVELHQFIIQLFRYLNKKYFAGFELTDEGNYWETNDIEVLKANFKKYNDLISGFSSALECVPLEHDESIENYFLRVLKIIQRGKKS